MDVTLVIIIVIVVAGVVLYLFRKSQGADDTQFLGSIRKAAETGDPIAEFKLASMLYEGKGLDRDDAEAAKWFLRAAEQDHIEAQFILGVMYEKGDGVARDDDQAYRWISSAARHGYARARVMLESDKWLNYLDAKKAKVEAREKDDSGHQTVSGEQIEEYLRRAEEGDVDAQYNLGIIYYHGEGVSRNFEEAIHWFHKAAESGDADAQYNLGFMYGRGEGVEKNHEQSLEWFKRASQQGHTGASEILEKMMRKARS